MVDLETVAISFIVGAGSSAIVGTLIAKWVQKTMKPKSETNFEKNRASDARWLFLVYKGYHDRAMEIFNYFEDNFDELAETRRELVTTMDWKSTDEVTVIKPTSYADIRNDELKMKTLRKRLQSSLDSIKRFERDIGNKEYADDLKNYFSYEEFVQPIFSLVNNINDYVEGLFQTELRPYSLRYAVQNAETVIKYLKDEEIDKNNPHVQEFIDNWENAITSLTKKKK
jgi:hypothetical protein